MDFGDALQELRDGERLAREGWLTRSAFVVLQAGYPSGIPINRNTAEATGIPEGSVCRFAPYFMVRTHYGEFVPWTPTHADLLGRDWMIHHG